MDKSNFSLQDQIKQNWGYLLPAALYTVWALAYIYHSSYAAMDGRRYFVLFDDAMISMRYAWNLAHGNGLVWNAGEYVEGYTNLLTTLLMAISAYFFEKRYAVLVIQLFGILFPVVTAYLAAQTLKTLNSPGRVYQFLLFAILLLYYPLSYWSLLGMETGLLASLLSGGVLCSLLYEKDQNPTYLWVTTFCFGLAYLTRNDSILFAAFAYLYLFTVIYNNKQIRLNYLASGLAFGIFPLGQLIFRLAYYGASMPNTYTLKLAGTALDERLRNGWGFVQPFLQEACLVLAFAIIALVIKPSRQKFYLFGFFLISLIYQLYVGGDPWALWRMLTPSMPFVYILFISAIVEILTLELIKLPHPISFLLFITLSATSFYFPNERFFPEITLKELPYNHEDAHHHINDAIAINALTKESASVGVFWAGVVPYYVDRYAIDFLGKSDTYIANLPPDISGQIAWDGMNSVPGHNKYDLNYSIKELRPTYVQSFEWGGQNLNAWSKGYYIKVRYKDTSLYLLKDSPDVNWELTGK